MATIYTLTIDPAALGITKPVDSVYIKNLYVDTDDTHIRTAPFEYGAAVIGETTFAELPPTTLGSIYQIQLFGIEGMALSVFFGMPEHNSLLSELAIYTAYPPRSYYPEASVSWGQIKGLIVDQTDLTDIMFTKDSAGTLQQFIDAKNTLQDNAITAANNLAVAAIPKTEKGTVNGVATLGADGKVTPAQLPSVTPVAWGNITGNITAQTDLIAKIPVVTQAQGQSTAQAVSQKLFTDTVGDIGTALDAINGVVV